MLGEVRWTRLGPIYEVKRRSAAFGSWHCRVKRNFRMLSSLANYLLGGNISAAQDSRDGSNNETPESLRVMARLSQVEVEGDDWILIDRAEGCPETTVESDLFEPAVEGATALEESWYVTPPPCFTRTTPVTVEISPLEDLLIEHPSMSVYRATASPVELDSPLTTPDAPEERDVDNDVFPSHVSGAPPAASLERSPTRNQDDRTVRRHSTPRIVLMFRSSQKVLEKRTTQALKRNRLDRSNKLREVFGTKGRQDRMRIHHSGANNNRKCY
ncbi:tumor protein p53 inducible nuclear protein isoform X2 [Lasioglossum baleicum]|uniref:tumor protein p53 inducible nuclear protein isoform X2 n=1 Tax=Lasioglossum baleicum TaxID=434251 RepID=UPI003FCDB014